MTDDLKHASVISAQKRDVKVATNNKPSPSPASDVISYSTSLISLPLNVLRIKRFHASNRIASELINGWRPKFLSSYLCPS